MFAGDEEVRSTREESIRRIRQAIRAAQLRVGLDDARGRPTPPAVVRLAQRTLPPLPSPLEIFTAPTGKLRTDPTSRRQIARVLRDGIRAAQLRVALDEHRGRPTPEAVKRLAQRKLPTHT
jgi:hypothetical protein